MKLQSLALILQLLFGAAIAQSLNFARAPAGDASSHLIAKRLASPATPHKDSTATTTTLAPSSTCLTYLTTPIKLQCGFRGNLSKPTDPFSSRNIRQLKNGYTSAFDECRDLCLNNTATPCASFVFDQAASNQCKLYNVPLDPQGPRNPSAPIYFDRDCYIHTCGESLLFDGTHEGCGILAQPAPGKYGWYVTAFAYGPPQNENGSGNVGIGTATCDGPSHDVYGFGNPVPKAFQMTFGNYSAAGSFRVDNYTGGGGGGVYQPVMLEQGATYDFALTYYTFPVNGKTDVGGISDPKRGGALNISFAVAIPPRNGFGPPIPKAGAYTAAFFPFSELVQNTTTIVFGSFTPASSGLFGFTTEFGHGYPYCPYPEKACGGEMFPSPLTFGGLMILDRHWLIRRPS